VVSDLVVEGSPLEADMRNSLALGTLLLATLAACGGSGSTAGGSASGSPVSGGGQPLAVRTTSLGRVLVDAQGRTVYMLTADSPGHATCGGQCLAYWPAVPVPHPVPSSVAGVTARVGSTTLPGGGRTLTAGGWPLYTFVQDSAPGQVHGQGVKSFGGVWYALSPAGKPVTGSASGPSTGRY
jgi:predicted lipoprotein with Yx(FWY)xxD motif